jgi:hypothetical protein
LVWYFFEGMVQGLHPSIRISLASTVFKHVLTVLSMTDRALEKSPYIYVDLKECRHLQPLAQTLNLPCKALPDYMFMNTYSYHSLYF